MADGLQEAIEVLEKFIEEASRPCLLGLLGKKVERRLGKDLSSYFTRLGNKLDPNRLSKLVETASTAASGRYAASHLARIAVKRMQPQLMAAAKAGYLDAIENARKHQHVAESVDDEPRDDHGRWTGMDSNSSSYLNSYEHGGEIGTKTTGNKAKHLLRIKGQVVGHMDVEYKGKDAVVKDVDLDEKYQGKGYGKAMYKHAINRAQAKGMTTFRSETSKENPAGNSEQAKNVWSSLGGKAVTNKQGNLDHHKLSIKEAQPFDLSVQEADQPFNRKDSDLLSDAVQWAEKQAGELVQGLDQTTVDSIADAVASGIENQLGADGTAREIKSILEDWATSRAFTIATTEINRAMSWATVDMFDGGYKRWVLAPEACPICEANADQGAIPVDDDFDSGDGYPPAHPNCRCAVTAARGPDEE